MKDSNVRARWSCQTIGRQWPVFRFATTLFLCFSHAILILILSALEPSSYSECTI